jgi:hypothetical protein
MSSRSSEARGVISSLTGHLKSCGHDVKAAAPVIVLKAHLLPLEVFAQMLLYLDLFEDLGAAIMSFSQFYCAFRENRKTIVQNVAYRCAGDNFGDALLLAKERTLACQPLGLGCRNEYSPLDPSVGKELRELAMELTSKEITCFMKSRRVILQLQEVYQFLNDRKLYVALVFF